MSQDRRIDQNTKHTVLQKEIDEFIVDRQVRSLSPRTILWYRNSLKVFSHFLIEQKIDATEKVTSSTIRRFLLSLPEKGYSQGGINNLFGAIKAFIRWYIDEYEPKDWNPLAKIQTPKRSQEIQKPLSIEDFQRLVSTCTGKTSNNLRDKAILLLLLDTGVRKQELTDLCIEDVDLVTGQVFIRSGKGKKSRTVYIGKKTKKAISAYLRTRKDDCNALWVTSEATALAYPSMRQIIRRRAKAANIKEPGLYEFRRAFAINFLRNGGNVLMLQRLLGHSNLSVIHKYVALVSEDLRIEHAKASPIDNL